MKYGLKYHYPNKHSLWGYPSLSFNDDKYRHTDTTFITDDINIAYKYQEELRIQSLSRNIDIVWWVEER